MALLCAAGVPHNPGDAVDRDLSAHRTQGNVSRRLARRRDGHPGAEIICSGEGNIPIPGVQRSIPDRPRLHTVREAIPYC